MTFHTLSVFAFALTLRAKSSKFVLLNVSNDDVETATGCEGSQLTGQAGVLMISSKMLLSSITQHLIYPLDPARQFSIPEAGRVVLREPMPA